MFSSLIKKTLRDYVKQNISNYMLAIHRQDIGNVMYKLVIKFHFVVVDDRSVSFGWVVYVGLPNKSL